MDEYIVFTVTTAEGEEVELAVVDEFTFENKNYVAASRVVGDAIDTEGVFIYKVKDTEEFEVEKITNHIDLEKIIKAYQEL